MVLYEFTSIATISREDCVTLATVGLNTVNKTDALAAVVRQATGSNLSAGDIIAFDSTPITEFTPRYLATPVRGCRAAAVCLTTNAETVLSEFADYSVVECDAHSFIYGNLNFTQDNNGYTPIISSSKVITFAIWA